MKYNIALRTVTASYFLCFSVLVVMTGCKGKGQNATATPPQKLPVITIKPGSATVTKVYSSALEGVTNVEVRPQVAGSLQKIFVDEGAYVRAGQQLFFIDDRVYRQQLNTATGALHNAEANLEAARINVAKTVPLVQNKVSSEINLQTAQMAYAAAKATVEQAQAAVESARINVAYCTITAPVNGYIGRIPFKLGSLVSSAGAQPLTLLSDIHNVNAYFSMAEGDFVNFEKQYPGNTTEQMLKKTPPVSLQLAEGSIYQEKGKITAIEGQFDKTTGSITLRATFPNAKSMLRSGNTGKILIDQQFDNVILFPIASSIEVQDKIYAFTVDDSNKVKQVMLQTAGKTGTDYIVTAGLQPGTRVVSKGFERLQDGMTIVPDTTK
ncbi:membrane fusion protein, multidrug efflux system [Chitinophaga costaii]|uniref:Membrane fusion protein, multidrug efflux system n=1 Tax=Chitinophaga costaii TaxID=1335309 RepID=A0A1C4FZW3_9BACT|nr:efflux RND transporter periplasmic adaptor subunit [Chitinophaga costaii]PUZ20947.1 efflux RND transporter periplasmic adaptor subunit [Chitinophaga costaii]SCC61243.1 membrane fusion protein, multidrug efflux system [Chitinophaga costaii]